MEYRHTGGRKGGTGIVKKEGDFPKFCKKFLDCHGKRSREYFSRNSGGGGTVPTGGSRLYQRNKFAAIPKDVSPLT